MDFCDKLKKVREILKISQETLARELNVSFATINRLESGKTYPSYSTLNSFDSFCRKNNLSLKGEDDQ